MSRSLSVALTLSLLLAASSASAQRAVPIPGTHATVVLPRGCDVPLEGTVECGDSYVMVGGSALTFEELRERYVQHGDYVRDLPTPTRSFFVAQQGGGAIFVRDGADERLIVTGNTEGPETGETGRLYATVFMAIAAPTRGPIVSGFGHLSRNDIPYATLYWVAGALFFTTTAVNATSGLAMGGSMRRVEDASMDRLCRPSGDFGPAETLVLHQERLGRDGAFCEEVHLLGGRTALTATFGIVMPNGEGYSIRMAYVLGPDDDAFRLIDGFRHSAAPLLQRAVR